MALILYRIGRWSYRNSWRVIITWLLLLGASLGLGLGLGGQMRESFEIPGTESQAALDRLEQVFPQVAGASAQVVLLAPEGALVTDAATEAAIEDVTAVLGDIEGVEQTLSPFSEYATDAISADERAAIITVQLTGTSEEVSDEILDEIVAAGDSLESLGLTVEYGGMVFQELDYGLTVTEVIGVVFAALVLFVTFGSVLAAGLPLISAIIAVGATMGVLLFVARFAVISSATPLLAVMIGLAVGIDYALFILSRHRTQLAQGMDAEESAATAVGTAGGAVTFAGVTVMIALLGLMIVGIPFLSVMGLAAAAGVFVAVACAVTFLPAMLGLAKGRLAPKPGSRAHKRHTAVNAKPTMGRRWVQIVLRRPVMFIVGVVAVLGVIALPALDLKLALPSGAGQPVGTTARDANDIIDEHWGPGANGPLLVMMDITQASNDSLLDDLQAVADEIAAVEGVRTTGDALPNPTVDSAILQVIPETGPDDPQTLTVVNEIRGLADDIEARYGITISVTGATAVGLDISDRLDGALLPFAAVVVGLSFVLLLLVFRSILVPLKAALSFLLSIFAAFGVVVAIFQWGWLADVLGVVPGPIISFMPIILMAIIFGLAMDYEVFLVSGMREAYVRGDAPKKAIEEGFANGARVVTAAALIMFFVFAAFVPEGAGVIKAIALGLAAGIAFDAFLVRMTLVPALMAILGRHSWWLPKWLDKVLPDLDIEGEKLREYRDEVVWAGSGSSALAFEQLRAGDERLPIGPISGRIERGGILVVTGGTAERRVFAATLGGRLQPVDGRLHVGGNVVPGDADRVIQSVAIVNLAELDDRSQQLTLGELIRMRASVGSRARKGAASDSGIAIRIDAINETLARIGATTSRLTQHTSLDTLDPLERGLALAQVALSEHPEVLIADIGGLTALAESSEIAEALIEGLSRLATSETTLVVMTPESLSLPAELSAGVARRPFRSLSLQPEADADQLEPRHALDPNRKDALR